MPLTKKGEKIEHAMEKEYGEKKGKQVFYASKNKGVIKGVEGKKKHVADKMGKKHEYSFITKGGFRIDASGSSAREAHQIARSQARHRRRHSKIGEFGHGKEAKLSGTYFKYDKDGLHSNEGPYYQIKPKRYEKGYKHS